MKLSRRNLLKSTGAIAASSPFSSSLGVEKAASDFNDLKERVDERREYREENGGSTIYLGSVDSLDITFPGGEILDQKDFNDVERMLEEGKTPEEIANSDNEELSHSRARQAEPVREKEEQVKLVHITGDDINRPLDEYSESLNNAFGELDPSLDLNVSYEQIDQDPEDVESLSDVSSGNFEGLNADLNLKGKYSEPGQEPIFLVESDVLPEAGGVSDYRTGVAFAELTDNEKWNKHVINHEAGHSLLALPHHYHDDGAMSYNPEANTDQSFHPRSRMIARALLTGETDYDVKTGTVSGFFDGERKEKRYKQIDITHESRNLETDAVTKDFFQHLDTYAEEVLGYDMGAWNPESHKLVEEEGDVKDIATYSHRDESEMTMKVGNYIEDMNLQLAK